MTDAGLVTLAVPCRTDEPALGRTLAAALASWRQAPQAARTRLEVLVCLNGPESPAPGAALRECARLAGAPLARVDLDAQSAVSPPPAAEPVSMVALATRRVGKPIAWNALRACARGALAIFVDADVSFAPAAFGRLLDALAARPDAALASAKTTCVARPGRFERIMAAPYGVDFPNLSAQLYAARVTALPATMPEDLIEPERWLELVLGRERLVRVPEVLVAVRLPGTLPDFFRQRVRIEMGKVQLAHAYPGLERRGAPPPPLMATLARLGAGASARLAVYAALRAAAHTLAWWRYRRGATTDIWRQAVSTKQWEGA